MYPTPFPPHKTPTDTLSLQTKQASKGSKGGRMPLVHLEAKDGKLDQPIEAQLLLPSDLLKSMLPEDRACSAAAAGEVVLLGTLAGVGEGVLCLA